MARIILGFMGAGKTTVSNLLDDQFLDMDTLIEEKIGMSITEFFAKEGEAAFRKIESALLEELIQKDHSVLVSTGGGVVTSAHNRSLLQANKRHNVLLSASFEVLYKRIEEDKVYQRPLFLNNSKEDFQAIFEKRMELYQDLAGLIIDVDERTPEEVARIIRCM